MLNTSKTILVTGAILGGLSVAIGAFGAHGLKDILIENGRVETFETAVKFQFYHSLALLLVGLISRSYTHKLVILSATFFLIGTLIFSVSLYILCLTNIGWLGAITPFGGTALLVGWGVLSVGVYQSQ